MKLDVFLTPGEITPADVAERTVVLIDVLRATSTMVQALSAGARAIYPVGSIEDALRLANTIGREEVLLCGERRCLPIEGFDLGNSPREFTRERIAGKTLVMSTTNGTSVVSLSNGAARVLVAALYNLDAVAEALAQEEVAPLLLCSGRERQFALEDALCAGELAARLMQRREGPWQLNDGARAALTLSREHGLGAEVLRATAAGRAIVDAGLEADLEHCARVDLHPVVPVFHDRNVTLAGSAPAS